MTSDYAHPHTFVKAYPHRDSGYAKSVGRRISLSDILASNIKAVRSESKLTQTKVKETANAKGYQLDQGTISRIERKEMAPTLDVIEALAVGLDVEPWQLLVLNIDPKNLPVLKEPTAEERALWKRLRDAAKQLGIDT